ncbi:hypothetical protein HK414_15990 [Ramlibacter terrae]|uniref:Uncharacterized protein n=1 Tax=Ramlibacter terrae TaxID=2732511 RepID=A0ABX6P3G5_9BURK|nr:hypothetical protein HK414_15990 [Ramlibacter terrae]
MAGQDLILSGTVAALPGSTEIGEVIFVAKGIGNVLKSFNLNGNFNPDGTPDLNDIVSEMVARMDFNGDGDMNDMVDEAAIATPTGFLNVQLNKFAATTTITQQYAAAQKQVAAVQFDAHAPALDAVYSVVVGSKTYSVTAGDATTPAAGTVAGTGRASSRGCRPRSTPTPAARPTPPSTPPRASSR